jgi:hypothetical protein
LRSLELASLAHWTSQFSTAGGAEPGGRRTRPQLAK